METTRRLLPYLRTCKRVAFAANSRIEEVHPAGGNHTGLQAFEAGREHLFRTLSPCAVSGCVVRWLLQAGDRAASWRGWKGMNQYDGSIGRPHTHSRSPACVRSNDAALGLAGACSAPFERSRTLVELATVHGSDASGWLEEARSIAERLHAAPLLARIDALTGRHAVPPRLPHATVLTARELDVLRLASDGLTDAAIGEHLFISLRTASQHLRSIYSKLGIRSRSAATRYAIEHHLT